MASLGATSTSNADIERGPAPGPGRANWVKHNGLVWTVGFPKGKSDGDDVTEQTRLTLACLDERLAGAGTDKSRVLEATVFLQNIEDKEAMDAVWRAWLPEGGGASRATVSVQLAHGQLIEIKVLAAAAQAP
mmetsp:Transcript_58281/g.117090  ORF Transcript_58281/g.117090 Transcript_58281/m.117090 type:complete len:132 (-) Transcript_58281:246-641(-)|eukprot:CAMPEP_0171595398 /NCGR_PEP_ID=MMETSP0990-20121206/1299_1 /TAXON_ID=483369 /ORGANISM="non described non described, Strain CCMP2098" /LENGTH=131 /DNA_ID=CAMNT_0012156347 /DNA_START=71 /DNA_END=466 /DNA_ORIENTATION=+